VFKKPFLRPGGRSPKLDAPRRCPKKKKKKKGNTSIIKTGSLFPLIASCRNYSSRRRGLYDVSNAKDSIFRMQLSEPDTPVRQLRWASIMNPVYRFNNRVRTILWTNAIIHLPLASHWRTAEECSATILLVAAIVAGMMRRSR
jgi:hypothetical protein